MKMNRIYRIVLCPRNTPATNLWVGKADTELVGRALVHHWMQQKRQDDYIEGSLRDASDLFLMWNKTWEQGSQDVRVAGTIIGAIEILEIEYYE